MSRMYDTIPDTFMQTIAKLVQENQRSPANSGVYFIQSGPRGPIKIGRANDVKHRRKALQPGNPVDLTILGVIRGGDAKFAHLNIRGEWFRDDHELRLYILENAG